MQALVTAAIVRDLNRGLGVSVARAVDLATVVLGETASERTGDADLRRAESDGSLSARAVVAIGDSLTLTIDVGRVERDIEHRLVDVMETAVPRRRGRPPRKERRGTR
jgi:hypothetical protein